MSKDFDFETGTHYRIPSELCFNRLTLATVWRLDYWEEDKVEDHSGGWIIRRVR